MKHYCASIDDVFKEVQSSREGLTSEQAESRLLKNGKNKLAEPEKDSIIKQFFKQMADPMIIMLLAAAVISAGVSFYSGDGEIADVIIILFVVVVNAVLGVYQENKAEKAIEALAEIAAATTTVLRDGKPVTIKNEDLVVGDVVLLESGDAIPADGRIIGNTSMKIEEAALTGESVPVSKFVDIINLRETSDVPLGDRKNMVYMGSTVVYGRGRAVVTATGMNTEMGKIADALSSAEEGETPLQIKLNQLSKVLSILVLAICAVIFVVGIIREGAFTGEVILSTFMIAVSLAVAAIPEGLVAVVTIVLSIGVTNMSKRNAIIRRLTAVETLGCAQIICSDKTGTLTQNKMTVTDSWGVSAEELAAAMALCSNAELLDDGTVTGEPTEAALVVWSDKIGRSKNDLKKAYPRIGEAPFDSSRKMMSTVHKHDGIIQYTKGAPDEILKKCVSFIKNGEIHSMTEGYHSQILDANKVMAGKALRVLAVACRKHDSAPETYEPQTLEHDLCFMGLAGMIDPVRPEVMDAIIECRGAGIRPIMITGDHVDTAMAIASELGILTEDTHAITGAQLSEMSDEEFEREYEKISVYARVQPEHKVKIVNMWRKAGYVTAMTGDGVNDAPSIKSADIGVGMGITGTDVTKNVSDMVLADDNFATIVSAIEEGRRIYDNIRKAIQFLLGSNTSEVLSVFFATMAGFTILEPTHLLWINLVTDCFPALALGMEPAEADIMEHSPRSAKDGVFAGGMGFDIVYQGVLITILTVLAYLIGHFIETGDWVFTNSVDGMTMAFLTMNMAEIFHSLNMRSQKGSIFKMKTKNTFLYLSALAALVLVTAVIYLPFLQSAFGLADISLFEYGVALLLAITVIPVVELVKFIMRASKSKLHHKPEHKSETCQTR